MKSSRIWQSYLLKETIKVLLLFIFSFYFLYVLIDYSMHVKLFTKVPLQALSSYYLCHFAKRADLILPLALLLATTKVLLTLNQNNELSAMLASGSSLKVLLRPLLLLALFISSLLYLNFETFEPRSIQILENIEDEYFIDADKKVTIRPVNHLPLDDSSKLVFHQYDSAKKLLKDVFWIQDGKHIIHMKSLNPYANPPQATYLTYLKRNARGFMEKYDSKVTAELTDLKIEYNNLFKTIIPIRSQSLSKLAKSLQQSKEKSDYHTEVLANLNYKLSMPLLAFLVVIGPSRYCTRFSRHLPVFVIYCIAIFGLISYFTLINAAFILAENNVFNPVLTIWVPFLIIAGFLGKAFMKIDHI